MKVEVHFLGQPEIRIDGSIVEITQKKVEAMLLYLLFNGSCTRDELVAIFWCDCDEEGARRNLRNSLYKIRNLIGKDFLLAGGKSYIHLNPSVEIERDTDLFVMENSEKRLSELTNCCFLDKFYLKNCPEFEEWVRSMENTYARFLIERLRPAMRSSFQNGDQVQAEKYAESILRVDAHNEEAAYLLMRICGQLGDYNRAAFVYNQFSEQLYQDLGLEPGIRMKEEYEQVLRLRTERRRTENRGPFYLGHVQALAAIQEEYSKYMQGCSYANCVICGEAGMGKKEVWQQFMDECGKERVVKVWLQFPDSSVEYFAIHQILQKISDGLEIPAGERETPFGGENADLHFINRIEWMAARLLSRGKRFILFLHNLEYADEKSRNLIVTCLFERMKTVIFMAASLNPCLYHKFSAFTRLGMVNGLRLLSLKPLQESECLRYLKECLPREKTVYLEERELYRYTGGNLRLLREVADRIRGGGKEVYAMQPKVEQGFLSLLQRLPGRQYEYLEYLSILEQGAEVEALSTMLRENPFLVTQELNNLLESEFLIPIHQRDHECLRIRVKMLRDLIYSQIAGFKKKELHKIALRYYEAAYGKGRKDFFVWSELKYHAIRGGQAPESLFYTIGWLRYQLDYFDEFFPAIPRDVEQLHSLAISRKEMYECLDTIQEEMERMKEELTEKEYGELQMGVWYLLGRALNRDGRRVEGLHYMERLIAFAERAGNEEMLLNGYIEALCYGVKAEDAELMEYYLNQVKRMDSLTSYVPEYGTILRQKGYCHILRKEYAKAEDCLKESIQIFTIPGFRDRYYYRAAGAFDYLAITYRCLGKYEQAQEAMEKAITLCTERGARKGLDLFYGDYAYTLFLQGKMKEAEEYFRLSAQIYDDFGTYWLRSVGESCMAVIHLERGEVKEALEHFRRAEIFSRKEKTKEELAVLEMARQRMRQAKALV